MEAPDIVIAIAVGILRYGCGVFQEIVPGPVRRRFGQAGGFQDSFVVIDQRGVPGEGKQILLVLPTQPLKQLGIGIVQELLDIGVALKEGIQLPQDAAFGH